MDISIPTKKPMIMSTNCLLANEENLALSTAAYFADHRALAVTSHLSEHYKLKHMGREDKAVGKAGEYFTARVVDLT